MAGNGFTAFRKIASVASETAHTTGNVPMPNRLLFGTMTLTPMQEFYTPEDEERNSISAIHRATPVAKHAEMRYESSLQFERAPDMLTWALGKRNEKQVAGINSSTNGTPETGNAKYQLWRWSPSMTEATTPVFSHIYYGDNSQVYAMRNAMCKSISLRYEMNNPVMVSAEFFGGAVKAITDDDVAGTDAGINGLPQIQLNDAVSQLTDIYLMDNNTQNRALFLGPSLAAADNAGANNYIKTNQIGSLHYYPMLHGLDSNADPKAIAVGAGTGANTAVQKSDVAALKADKLLSSLNITLPTGFEMTRYSSGSLDFTDYSQMKRSASIDMTIRHSDKGRLEFDKFLSSDTFNRSRLLRLVTKHGDNETLSSVVFRRFIVIDMAILYNDSPEFFTDVNGDNCFTMKASSYHDPNFGRDFQVFSHGQVTKEVTAA